MTIIKALHLQSGGKWTTQLEEVISGAIEWVLDEIREDAANFLQSPLGPPEDTPSEPDLTDPEVEPPPATGQGLQYNTIFYGIPSVGESYDDDDLVYVDQFDRPTMYIVVPAGDRPFLPVNLRTFYSTVGGIRGGGGGGA